jgi:hypothetical protein
MQTLNRPYGTEQAVVAPQNPAINRWAIINRPSGTKRAICYHEFLVERMNGRTRMSSPFSENPYQTPETPTDPAPNPAPSRSRRYSTEAIAALVCSSVGCAFCGILVDPPFCGALMVEPISLILSIIALSKIRNDPNLQGRGMAMAGMVISISVLAMSLLVLLILFGASFRSR